MAPFLGPKRDVVLRMLESTDVRLPMTLGKYSPAATIERDGADWVLRPLVLDKAACERAAKEALAPGGSGHWMPESEWQYLEPGDAIVRAPTREAFLAALRKLRWRWS